MYHNRPVEKILAFMIVFWPTLLLTGLLLPKFSRSYPTVFIIFAATLAIAITIVIFRFEDIKTYYQRFVSPCLDCHQTNTAKDHRGRCPQCHEKTVAEDAEELAQHQEEALHQQERARLSELDRREAFKQQCRTLVGL